MLARACLAVLLCGLMGFALVGCALEPEAPPEVPPKPSPPVGTNQGRVGDPIRLAERQLALRVRVTDILDPLPVPAADVPLGKGARFVGVAVEITNVGKTVYDESPLGGSALLTRDGRETQPVGVLGGPCARGFASNVRVEPGQTRSGCVAFEVPRGGRLGSFRYAIGTTSADETGTWRIG